MRLEESVSGAVAPARRGAAARPLGVAMFTPSAHGGHARYTQELLTALALAGGERGVRPSLVTSVDLGDDYRTDAYPIHAVLPRLAPRSEFRGKAAWALSRLTHYPRRDRSALRWADGQAGLDVFHAQESTPWVALWLYRELKRRGVAVAETVHNIHLHHYMSAGHRRVHDATARAAWRVCDALLVHTEGLAAELSDFLGAGHPPVFVTPHGVWGVTGGGDAPPADPSSPLLFFGVVRENKGLHVLVRAMGHLPGRRLTVAGHFVSAAYREEVDGLIARHAPGRVDVTDRFVSEAEAAELFRGAGLVVLPYTTFAAQSGVLHQALAHVRPVVVSDVGALGESVRSWGIGGVVPAGDPRALADGIISATEPGRFRASAAAAERARDSLSWSRTAALTIDAYEAAVARRGGRR